MSTSIPLTNAGGGAWGSGGTLRLCNVDYLLVFHRPGPGGVARLVITAATGSGASYEAIWSRCGTDYVEFGIGTPEVCSGEVAPCDENTAIIRVAKAHCNYTVPGWYCIRDCGSTGTPVAALLEDADATDMTIEIVGGPFATEEEAGRCLPVCAPAEGPERTFSPGPKVVTFKGTLAPLGTQTLTWDATNHRWYLVYPFGAGPSGMCGQLWEVSLTLSPLCVLTFFVSTWSVGEHFGRGLLYGVEPSSDLPFAFDLDTDPSTGPTGSPILCDGILPGASFEIAEG